MYKKRNIKKSILLMLLLTTFIACKNEEKKEMNSNAEQSKTERKEHEEPFFKLSLAQWSLHIAMDSLKTISNLDFAKKGKELGFSGLEYVSQLYELEKGNEDASLKSLVQELKARSEEHGMDNVLIMIDGEGDLAHADNVKRDSAILKHTRWVKAAAALGCTSVRVNLTPYVKGDNEKLWHDMSVDGLGRLADIGAEHNINVIVENHGGISSNGKKLAAVLKEVNKDNCGALPDFGNFCIDGSPTGDCKESYDRYIGVTELMPFAKGVSAKSYDFDEEGNETTIDYTRMLQIVKDAGYNGYIGVEYEGEVLTEEEGIVATRKLLIRIGKELN